MRKNSREVIDAFRAGSPLGSLGSTIHTDGTHIYSYQMVIAWRVDGGFKVVDLAFSPSRTTSSHIRDCMTGLGVSAFTRSKKEVPAPVRKVRKPKFTIEA